MIKVLIDNPLLLLFVVAALGYALGRITIAGSSLGVAAVLFAGLGVGALDPGLQLPELIYQLGLVLFVYTVGLSSGRRFFASFRRKGLRDTIFVVAILGVGALLAVAAGSLFGLRSTLTAGLYAGSLTNTPALAAVLDYVKRVAPVAELEQLIAEPVVGFSIAYPMGVIAMILCISVLQRLWKIDYVAEARRVQDAGATSQQLLNRTITITRPEATTKTVEALVYANGWDIVFGRMRHDGQLGLTNGHTRLALGDRVSVVGSSEALEQATAVLGTTCEERLDLDRSEFDYRRVFVSNPKLAGHRLRDLNLPQHLGAFVTRIRRGDIEMLAHGDSILELGDRVRIVARRDDMDAVSHFFGDSYRAISEIDILTFTLGLAGGLLIGMLPLPLPGGVVLRLGMAGGPLMVALILGALERSGPLVWNLPYSANLTLRQLGLILFLAGIGTRSGYTFMATVSQGGGALIFVAGCVITTTVALLTLWIGHRLLKIPMGLLLGMVAGVQTQPAVLGYALEQSGDELPNVGYSAVYPIALISKILFAQLLVALLS